jgi:prolyl oligopeptidase
VFDDFIAAAEFLINQNFTNPKRIAIEGRSNGGLLTAVCAQQAPNLFAAAIVGVGYFQ